MCNGTGMTDVCKSVAWIWMSIQTPARGQDDGPWDIGAPARRAMEMEPGGTTRVRKPIR